MRTTQVLNQQFYLSKKDLGRNVQVFLFMSEIFLYYTMKPPASSLWLPVHLENELPQNCEDAGLQRCRSGSVLHNITISVTFANLFWYFGKVFYLCDKETQTTMSTKEILQAIKSAENENEAERILNNALNDEYSRGLIMGDISGYEDGLTVGYRNGYDDGYDDGWFESGRLFL